MKFADLKQKRAYNSQKIVPALREAGLSQLAESIEKCGNAVSVATCKQCGTKYFAGISRCKSRFCSVCARARADAWIAKLVPLFEEYSRQGYAVFFVTYTLQDQDDLLTAVTALRNAWRIMTHDDRDSRTKFRALNSGGVRSVEIKIGQNSGKWHAHFHTLVLFKPPAGVLRVRQFEAYRDLWDHATRTALGASEKVGSVDVRGIRDRKGKNGLVAAIVETMKYIVKSDWISLPSEQVRELVGVTKGKHFVSSWGDLYGFAKQVEELLSASSEEELRTKACSVCGCTEFELELMLGTAVPQTVREFD